MYFPHLALVLLNTGHFHLSHSGSGQRLSYLEDLTVVRSDDPDVIGNCRVVETQSKMVGEII